VAGAQSRNEPAELPRIAQELAGLRGMSVEDVAAANARNACRVLPRLAALVDPA
jgi:TatD DNase family protein